MKTTVEIDDPLFVAAKKRAAELHVPMRVLIERGLRQQISKKKYLKSTKRINWITADGGLPNDLDLNERVSMHHWLAKD